MGNVGQGDKWYEIDLEECVSGSFIIKWIKLHRRTNKFPFKRNQYLHFDLVPNISEPVVDMSETTVAAEGLPPLGPSGPPPRKCQPRRGIPRAARCSSASLASGHGRRIPEQRRNTHLPRLCKPLVRHCLRTGNRDYCSQNKGRQQLYSVLTRFSAARHLLCAKLHVYF